MAEWLASPWSELIETVGIVGGLLFNAYTARKDERARQTANMIAIDGRSADIWQECYRRPELFRVLEKNPDLNVQPITNMERLFVKTLILHLGTTWRARKAGMLVEIEGLKSDVCDSLSLPIPKAVWEKIKKFQNRDFVAFVESCRNAE